MERDERRANALDRYWDLAKDGRPIPRPDGVDAETEEIVDRLRRLGESPRIVSDPGRGWEEVLDRAAGGQATGRNSESLPGLAALPAPAPSANGRYQHELQATPAARPGRLRQWSATYLATAALLVVTMAGLYLGLIASRDMPVGAGWPMFRGDAARTGISSDPGPTEPPSVRWRFRPETPNHPTLVVAGDTVYVGGDNQYLYALDAAWGQERWRFGPGSALVGVPAVANGTVYFGTKGGILVALDAENGNKRWSADLGGPICCSPAVTGETVYLGTDAGDFFALDAATGAQRWRFHADGVSWSSAAVADGTVFVGTNKKRVYAFDAATGTERWQATLLGTGVVPVVAVAGGTVYAATWHGALFALDAATGAERWRFVGDRTVYSPAVAGGTVYAGSDDGNLYAVDAATGQERWRVPLGDRIDTEPVVAGETVFVAGRDGYLTAIDALTGVVRWHSPVAPIDFGPVISGELVYVVDEKGSVYALAADGTPPPNGTPVGAGACDCDEKGFWLR